MSVKEKRKSVEEEVSNDVITLEFGIASWGIGPLVMRRQCGNGALE